MLTWKKKNMFQLVKYDTVDNKNDRLYKWKEYTNQHECDELRNILQKMYLFISNINLKLQ